MSGPQEERSTESTYGEAWSLAYCAISSSVFAEPRGPDGAPTNPSQARAVINRLASLMAATIVLMSKSVDRELGLMRGGSNGSALLSLTSPPVQELVRAEPSGEQDETHTGGWGDEVGRDRHPIPFWLRESRNCPPIEPDELVMG